jgi:preprotein translocase subunit YajC
VEANLPPQRIKPVKENFMSLAFIAQAAQSGASGIIGFLPFILILVVLYFLMLRPQMKKQKEHAAMLKSVTRGDDIVTAGGIHGKVVGINEKDNSLQVMIAKGIVVNLEHGSVARKKVYEKSAEAPALESKPIEPKPRRQDRATPTRESSSGGQPGSAMIVSGTRTSTDRPGSNGTDTAKKSRYRRSRRRKPPFGQGQGQGPGQSQSQSQGQTQTQSPGQTRSSANGSDSGSMPSSTPDLSPRESSPPEQHTSGESHHVEE